MLILPEIWSSPVYTFFFISRRVNSPPRSYLGLQNNQSLCCREEESGWVSTVQQRQPGRADTIKSTKKSCVVSPQQELRANRRVFFCPARLFKMIKHGQIYCRDVQKALTGRINRKTLVNQLHKTGCTCCVVNWRKAYI